MVQAAEGAFTPPDQRPRHAVVVVVDGLREDAARTLSAVAQLSDAGQCRSTNNGALTVSRPVYTVLSSGLEADRTGSRNNDLETPVAVDSIWNSARGAGLSVSGYSELTWWQQLFPNGFSTYIADDRVETNLFELAHLTDLTLIHPVYVDHAGHEQGADSTMYREAVARLDRELSAFIGRLDFDRDLLVLTADHGHTASGGHGGPQPVVSSVLTCFRGLGIAPADSTPANSGQTRDFDLRSLAPTLAVLLGVPFPAHMRATDDRLDDIWGIVSLPTNYADARKRGVEAMRSQNSKRLAEWLDSCDEPTWDALYARARRAQLTTAGLALALVALLFAAFVLLGKLGWKRGVALALWMAATAFAAATLYSLVRGGFGWNSINTRAEFVRAAVTVSVVAIALASVAHLLIWRRPFELARDLAVLAVLVLALAFAHLRVYGDPLGFPLPSDAEMFFPFFAPALIIAATLGTIVASIGAASAQWRRRRVAGSD